MKWQEIKIITMEPCVETIAGLLHHWGAGGVIIEDPALVRAHIEAGDWELHGFTPEYLEQEHVILKAYYPENAPVTPEAIDEIMRAGGTDCRVEVSMLDEEDWAENWKEYYHVTRIGQRLVIKPSWREYQPEEGDIVITLDPGMAFGTGTHATTRQCLVFLEQTVQKGDRVLDIGTGSGILSIAAALLGAGEVLALDIDPVAVEAANRNAEDNGVKDRMQVQCQDFADFEGDAADVLTANLTGPILARFLPKIAGLIRSGGWLIAAGIGAEQWPAVQAVMQQCGLKPEQVEFEEDWVGVLARRV